MKFMNLGTKAQASYYVATELFKEINFTEQPVLGLATGGTMEDMYGMLVDLLKKNNTDVSKIESFNLDEYLGLESSNDQSYASYMKQFFFTPVGMNESQYHLPDGTGEDVDEKAVAYDEAIHNAGPLTVQLLGIGENGHIGFNEPGTPFDSKTRIVDLTEETINANARFFDKKEDVPTQAVSMGISTINYSERVILLALGEKKADIMAKLYNMTESDETVPASSLLNHPNVEIVMDNEAAKYIEFK